MADDGQIIEERVTPIVETTRPQQDIVPLGLRLVSNPNIHRNVQQLSEYDWREYLQKCLEKSRNIGFERIFTAIVHNNINPEDEQDKALLTLVFQREFLDSYRSHLEICAHALGDTELEKELEQYSPDQLHEKFEYFAHRKDEINSYFQKKTYSSIDYFAPAVHAKRILELLHNPQTQSETVSQLYMSGRNSFIDRKKQFYQYATDIESELRSLLNPHIKPPNVWNAVNDDVLVISKTELAQLQEFSGYRHGKDTQTTMAAEAFDSNTYSAAHVHLNHAGHRTIIMPISLSSSYDVTEENTTTVAFSPTMMSEKGTIEHEVVHRITTPHTTTHDVEDYQGNPVTAVAYTAGFKTVVFPIDGRNPLSVFNSKKLEEHKLQPHLNCSLAFDEGAVVLLHWYITSGKDLGKVRTHLQDKFDISDSTNYKKAALGILDIIMKFPDPKDGLNALYQAYINSNLDLFLTEIEEAQGKQKLSDYIERMREIQREIISSRIFL